MTHDDVLALMEAIRAATGCPYAYDHFAEGGKPGSAFSLFPLSPGGRVWRGQYRLPQLQPSGHRGVHRPEDPELEQKVEAVLSAYELFYHKSEVWIEEEKMYEVLYELTV